jgi:hypothetical protein
MTDKERERKYARLLLSYIEWLEDNCDKDPDTGTVPPTAIAWLEKLSEPTEKEKIAKATEELLKKLNDPELTKKIKELIDKTLLPYELSKKKQDIPIWPVRAPLPWIPTTPVPDWPRPWNPYDPYGTDRFIWLS